MLKTPSQTAETAKPQPAKRVQLDYLDGQRVLAALYIMKQAENHLEAHRVGSAG